MKYLILFLTIFGLSTCDTLMTIVKDNHQSIRSVIQKEVCECLIMGAVCGLGMCIELLGQYYQSTKLSELIGICIAGTIFMRIIITNTISIFENYAELNPNAVWAKKMTENLKKLEK